MALTLILLMADSYSKRKPLIFVGGIVESQVSSAGVRPF
jgi:hypothetical protein